MQIEDRERIAVPEGNTRVDAIRERKLGLLELSRTRLLHEIASASGDRFREMKRRALRHIEAEIAALSPR
ncbi:MAG TPA: hypothetical protein VFC21_09075 [Bryobacteraceae bacterium]|nr:hypothetical protein [Bryobacteraceae bacterium]